MNPLAIPMFSRKKLNTYGVESPCECLPRVGEHSELPWVNMLRGAQRHRCCAFLISSFQKGGGTQADHVCKISACIGPLTQAHTSEKAHIGVG